MALQSKGRWFARGKESIAREEMNSEVPFWTSIAACSEEWSAEAQLRGSLKRPPNPGLSRCFATRKECAPVCLFVLSLRDVRTTFRRFPICCHERADCVSISFRASLLCRCGSSGESGDRGPMQRDLRDRCIDPRCAFASQRAVCTRLSVVQLLLSPARHCRLVDTVQWLISNPTTRPLVRSEDLQVRSKRKPE